MQPDQNQHAKCQLYMGSNYAIQLGKYAPKKMQNHTTEKSLLMNQRVNDTNTIMDI